MDPNLTSGAQPGDWKPPRAEEPNRVTAIDILLDPDATMLERVEAANQRLLKVFPKGFSVGAEHQPHISCLQRFVETADLDEIYEAVSGVLAGETPAAWKLKAYKYYYLPAPAGPLAGLGLAGIVIEPSEDLIRFQKKLIEAVDPFTAETGTGAAFVTTKLDPDINQPTIDYVATFVPDRTGNKFAPHVTIGIAPQAFLKEMLAETFEAFAFSPVAAAAYQLGNFGTAQKELKRWEGWEG
jgi:2'-5' RNA ligase superfamily